LRYGEIAFGLKRLPSIPLRNDLLTNSTPDQVLR
jgi:hypothetical protein